MTTPYRKKLIEVALPLEAINRESARENYIYRGNPSAVHKWWAQRPLAACRAVLFAQLVDDPDSDPAYRRADGTVDEDAAGVKRAQLFTLIEELVLWENSNNERVINAARAEIARCVASRKIETGELAKDTIIFGKGEGKPHPKGPLSGEFRTAWEVIVHGHGDLDGLTRGTVRLCPPEVVNHFLATYAPPVLDPFAGGGSIPLEAQRLGLRAYASDLNPVAVLINKALIEIPPKFANLPPVNPEARHQLGTRQYRGAEGLAEDVRYYGKWMRDEAEKRIGHLYPKAKVTEDMAADRTDLKPYVGQELTVIAWLWARTVPTPDPAYRNARVPLLRTFNLSTKSGDRAWLEPEVDRSTHKCGFGVKVGTPGTEFDPGPGTVGKNGARCILSGSPIPLEYVRDAGRRGLIGQQLLALAVSLDRRRTYLPAPAGLRIDVDAASIPGIPDTEMPEKALGFRVQQYGYKKHRDLFTGRQLLLLRTLHTIVTEAKATVTRDAKAAQVEPPAMDTAAYANAIATYLAFICDKVAMYNCAFVPWYTKENRPSMLFGRQALSMVWDFAELNPFTSIGGSVESAVTIVSDCIAPLGLGVGGIAVQADAAAQLLASSGIISTDPPYYDNVPYADLSDFFYTWLRSTLLPIYPDLLRTLLTPKDAELIADPFRYGDAAALHFRQGMEDVLGHMRHTGDPQAPVTVYYAFKQSESDSQGDGNEVHASTGWETMLEAVVRSGHQITGTIPLRTERTGRLRDSGSNALASSIVIVCRPRDSSAPMATRREFLTALKCELPDALRHLQLGNIAPVDLAQAAIGPGMAVFSRYSKVVESDGPAMTVRAALGLINQTLDEVLAEQEGEFDADTRWAVAWFEQYGTDEGAYGVAETLSKAKNTSVEGLVQAGVVAARSGKVKLLGRNDMPEDWSPATDTRLTTWEATQYLIRALDQHGEQGAAGLLRQLGGGLGEMARDLSYRLYSICERKGWAQGALAYNSLVIAWSEITRLARVTDQPGEKKQTEMF